MKKTVLVPDRGYTSPGEAPKVPISVAKAPWEK